MHFSFGNRPLFAFCVCFPCHLLNLLIEPRISFLELVNDSAEAEFWIEYLVQLCSLSIKVMFSIYRHYAVQGRPFPTC